MSRLISLDNRTHRQAIAKRKVILIERDTNRGPDHRMPDFARTDRRRDYGTRRNHQPGGIARVIATVIDDRRDGPATRAACGS